MLEDAGKDPIKRAELIGNLVQSISIIPEAIVRDVYIKECAQLLHVEDKLLVSEVAKRREKQAEQQAERAERERRSANAARANAEAEVNGSHTAATSPDAQQAGYPSQSLPAGLLPKHLHLFHPRKNMYPSSRRRARRARSSINTNDLF